MSKRNQLVLNAQQSLTLESSVSTKSPFGFKASLPMQTAPPKKSKRTPQQKTSKSRVEMSAAEVDQIIQETLAS